MRKFKKYLISVFAVFILCFTFSTIKVSASDLGQTDGNAHTNQTEATEANPNASEESFHKDKTGYLVYLASTSGELTSDVVFVPYNNPPSGNIDSGFLKSRIGNKLYDDYYRGGGGDGQVSDGLGGMY